MAYNPLSFQLYLDSSRATYLENATLRNKMSMSLNEPLVVPDGYVLTVSLVDAQIPVTWATLYKYILVGTNLKSRNQFSTSRYMAKIPQDVATGYRLVYVNYPNYKHPVSDRKVDLIEIGIYAEDGTNISLGAGINWSCTLQFDFIPHPKK